MSRFDRQSFLGPDSNTTIAQVTVGFVGLGGGGSHAVQQFAHLGGRNAVLVDADVIEESNLNRLVGGTMEDVVAVRPKVEIAYRVIKGLVANPEVQVHQARWQEVLPHLKGCEVIVGALDTIAAKDELDSFCKRYLIPYIDIGMDIHKTANGFQIAGQVVLTSPGGPCLRCLGVVRETALAREAQNYGAAGSKPQVVWPNGVLASTAIGLLIQLLCPWHCEGPVTEYLSYDGNQHTIRRDPHLAALKFSGCRHHFESDTGDFRFDARRPFPA